VYPFLGRTRYGLIESQVLDATLKEITSALLESDVNVKLVASLRTKVKAKVKAALDAQDKSKESNRRNLIQQVRLLSQQNDELQSNRVLGGLQ
jgi:signal recognition particle subunit SRP54